MPSDKSGSSWGFSLSSLPDVALPSPYFSAPSHHATPPPPKGPSRSSFELKNDLDSLLAMQATLMPARSPRSRHMPLHGREDGETSDVSGSGNSRGDGSFQPSAIAAKGLASESLYATDAEKTEWDQKKGRAAMASVNSKAAEDYAARMSRPSTEFTSAKGSVRQPKLTPKAEAPKRNKGFSKILSPPLPPPSRDVGPLAKRSPTVVLPGPISHGSSAGPAQGAPVTTAPADGAEGDGEVTEKKADDEDQLVEGIRVLAGNDGERIQVVVRVRPGRTARLGDDAAAAAAAAPGFSRCLELSDEDPTTLVLNTTPTPTPFKFDYVAGEVRGRRGGLVVRVTSSPPLAGVGL